MINHDQPCVLHHDPYWNACGGADVIALVASTRRRHDEVNPLLQRAMGILPRQPFDATSLSSCAPDARRPTYGHWGPLLVDRLIRSARPARTEEAQAISFAEGKWAVVYPFHSTARAFQPAPVRWARVYARYTEIARKNTKCDDGELSIAHVA